MSAKRAYSDRSQNSPDRYSDDFISDDDKRSMKEKSTPVKNSTHQNYRDKLFGRGSGSLRGQGHGLRKGRGNGRRNSRGSEPADMKKNSDSVATRVLSASRNRINELRNKIEELKITIRELEQENKLYKTTQFRQEKTIKTFSDKENDLPMILEKHNNEIRALKEQNRRLREKYEKSDRYLRDAEDELEKVKKKMNNYKEICEDKELLERDELNRKLVKVELELEEKETKIKELQKHIEVLKKSHRHEMGIEAARQKDIKKQLEELTEKYSQLENQLKERGKALGYQNIYSNLRQGKSSRNHSPDSSSLTLNSRKKTTSMTELTPRERAKFYSEKQRAELYKQKDMKEDSRKKSQKGEPPDVLFRGTNKTLEDTESLTEWDKKEQSNNAKEDMNKLEDNWLHRQKNELQTGKKNDNLTKDDRERKYTEERKRQEREEEQKLQLKERQKKSDHEMKETSRIKEKQDHVMKKKLKSEEDESEKQLLTEDFESDSFQQEERRKKDELLRKLNTEDGSFSKSLPLKKSEDRASGMKEINEHSPAKPMNNVHNTKPPHEHITSTHKELQKNKRQILNDDADGYRPSFGPTRGSVNKPTSAFNVDDDDEPVFRINNTSMKNEEKKPNLLESLFGPQANTSKNPSTRKVDNNEAFYTKSPSSNQQTVTSTNSTFPWETTSGPTKPNQSTFNSDPENNSGKGGGPGLSNNDNRLNVNSEKLPPRQPRQQNTRTFPAKPSITAVESFGDDIEEFVL